MKKFKFLCICLLVALCACLFAGCGNPYGAELDSHARKYLSEEFLDNNRVRGAFYWEAGDYDKNAPENRRKYVRDKTSPGNRTYIITEEAQFREIFTKYEETIDFNERQIILYIFANTSPRDYYIKNIYLADGKLEIDYISEVPHVDEDTGEILDDATMPYPRCFMLKIDRVDFDEVEFIKSAMIVEENK